MKLSIRSEMNTVLGFAALLAVGSSTAAIAAITAPAPVSTPVGAGVQSAGGLVTAVGQGHAGVAPIVYGTAPAAEPFADGVTQGLTTVGSLTSLSGQRIQQGGLSVTPATGVKTAVQTVKNGSIVQVKLGATQLGKGAGAPIIGVGALTSSPPQGTLATAGVANANSLLNANVAPQ